MDDDNTPTTAMTSEHHAAVLAELNRSTGTGTPAPTVSLDDDTLVLSGRIPVRFIGVQRWDGDYIRTSTRTGDDEWALALDWPTDLDDPSIVAHSIIQAFIELTGAPDHSTSTSTRSTPPQQIRSTHDRQ